jgi:LuxR family transcriptional regulator, maltose regulon positive regulatory protein
LTAFTRQYFRAFFRRLPRASALVLDNCHTVAANARFNEILRDALAEVGDGLTLLMISRGDPPPTLARAEANRLIVRLGADDLRLTPDETRQIVLSERAVDDATLKVLQARCEGWAAGLVLMLEHLKASGTIGPARPGETPEGAFHYFAGQVFDQVDAATRNLLLCTAFLPRVTAAAAEALTDDPNAATLLEALFRQRLFTDKHSGEQVSYQFHALFGEFLRSRASTALAPTVLRELRAKSAALLERAREPAAALALWTGDQDWDAATALILTQARGLVARGRWLTLKAWIALLPKTTVEKTPWLTAWYGSALVLVDPPKARATLTRAFEALDAAGDQRGRIFCAAGIIEAHNIAQTGFEELDRWIDVLEPALTGRGAFRSDGERLRVQTAFVVAALLRQPGHALLAPSLAAVRAVIGHDVPITAQADAATQLLQYFSFVGDLRSARELVADTAPIFDRVDLPPFRHAGWLVFFSYYAALVGAYERGLEALDRLATIVQDFGMTWFRFYGPFFRALLELMGPTPLAASSVVQQLAHTFDSTRPVEMAQYQLLRVLHYQALKEPSLAVYHGELCLDAVRKTHCPFFNILFSTVVASALVEAGRADRALGIVAEAQSLAKDTVYSHHEPFMLMVEAYARQARDQRERAHELLAEALRRGRAEQSAGSFRWLVLGFRRLLATAIREDVEADCARALITEFGICAESSDVEQWPWPVRVRTLGGFVLSVAGAPVRAPRKAQKKPLELLKALIAEGGRGVSAGQLTELLWPDAEGDAADDALEVTVRRLRKLLGREDALVLADGRLSLNPGCCWLDIWAFEHEQNRVDSLLGPGIGAATDMEVEAAAARLMNLYRGPFLAGEDEKNWLLGRRQRLASQVFRSLIAIGERWESQGAPDRAELVYRRGVELDATSEPLYRRLMAVQLGRGHRSEALESYRRCHQMLAATLSVEPSAETKSLYRRIQEKS